MGLEIRYVPTGALTAYDRNPRTHPEQQIAQIAASIAEFGFASPIVTDRHHTIVAGHGRWVAAQRLGLAEVPVVTLDHLTDTQRRALAIADNRAFEGGGYDERLLASELERLAAEDFDLSVVGFSEGELDTLLSGLSDGAEPEVEGETPEKDLPETPTVPVSRPGDVWQIGPHRLACGDAGDPEVVGALMDGKRARLCFTSPPYGHQREYTTGGVEDWEALMRSVFVWLPMARDGQVLVNLGLIHRDNEVVPYWDGWIDWMRRQGWRRFAWYVWDQGPGMPGDWNGRLAPSFELVFHFNRQARKPHKIVPCKFAGQDVHLRNDGTSSAMRMHDGQVGDWSHAGRVTQDYRIPDSVIRLMRHKGGIGDGIDHPAVFPVALPEYLMQAYTDPADLCYEPFCGSGTSLLAAEWTGRRCYAVEIAPAYMDVALIRFRRAFPEMPVTLEATGQTFEEVTEERVSLETACA